jgi:hypothetical protein
LSRPQRIAFALLVAFALASPAILHAEQRAAGLAYFAPFAPHLIDYRLLLIGDAGAPDPDGEPALRVLNARAGELPLKTTVVFLGDNVYETGMPDAGPLEDTPVEEILDEVLLNLYESREEAERKLNAQVDAVTKAGAGAIFVPGNHDWDQFGIGGWDRIRALDEYIDELRARGDTEIVLAPSGGCPGPVSIDLGTRLRVIAIDTQWWLKGTGDKPTADDNPTGCRHLTEAAVRQGLARELSTAGDRETVVVAHHPLSSIGPHGGHYPWFVHLFPLHMLSSYVPRVTHWLPLPVVGSAMVWARQWRSPTVQDLSNPRYRRMREELLIGMEMARGEHAPLLFAAGHDHSLQLFEERFGPTYSLVSGLGSSVKASAVGRSGAALFAHSDGERPGLMQVDFAVDGRVRLAVFVWDPALEQPSEAFALQLETDAERQTIPPDP